MAIAISGYFRNGFFLDILSNQKFLSDRYANLFRDESSGGGRSSGIISDISNLRKVSYRLLQSLKPG
jgi:hypothetical protein